MTVERPNLSEGLVVTVGDGGSSAKASAIASTALSSGVTGLSGKPANARSTALSSLSSAS